MGRQSKRVRYAVIGAGNIAQEAVLPAFANASENSELVAILSSDEDKRSALAERYGVTVAPYDDLEKVLEEQRVDAVYIALPNTLHRQYTERAAKKGVHVLCEKPMADTVEDCEAMIEVCKKHRVRLMIAYRLHFEEANLTAVETANSGDIGEPRVFSSVFSQQVRPDDVRTKEKLGGGALLDMGVYCINAARYLFRSEPEQVIATRTKSGDPRFDGVDETTTAILQFPKGRVAQFTTSLSAATVSSYRIVGTKGDLRVEPAYEYASGLTHHLTVGEETSERSFPLRDQFAPELVSFSRCVLENREPEASGEEGLADIRIAQAIFDSADQGCVVRLEPFTRTRRPDLSQVMKFDPPPEQKPVDAPSPRIQ